MNILIDGRTFVKSSAGISTFLEGSLDAWARLCPNDAFYLALPQEKDKTAEKLKFPKNVRWIVSNNDVVLEKDTIENLLKGHIDNNASLSVPKIYYWNTDKIIWAERAGFSV